MSFDDPRQFTNQMAYQSYFSPPGFSFESPFGYPNMDMSMNANGNSNAQAGPSSMPMGTNMPHSMPMSMPMDIEPGRSQAGMNYMGGGGQGSGSGGGMQLGSSMSGASWMTSASPNEDKGKYDMSLGPAVNLPTGDRFSQLLERKLGMDIQSQSSQSFSIDPNPQPNMAFNAFPSSTHLNRPYQPSLNPSHNQNWDRLAVEANLQDYRQVHVHPDLVAPAIPAAFFSYPQQQTQSLSYDTKVQAQTQEYRSPTPYPSRVSVTLQQQQQIPYMSYQGGFDNSLATSTFPLPSPLPTSNRSSPSTHSHQLITPQPATHPLVSDMSWSTHYTNTQPQMQYSSTVPPPTRPQAIPPPAGQSIYTGYQPTTQQSVSRHDASSSAPPPMSTERTRLAAMSGSMGAMPIAHSRSLPGPDPSTAVNMNGMWSREMHPSSSYSSGSGSTTQVLPTQTSHSPPQMKRSPIDGLPTSLPSAPVVSKRSRSPHHSHSSGSPNGRSPATSSTATDTKPKRPKLSMPHPMPSVEHDHDEEHEHDDEEKKVVIACHTCRARKLKCDGARPKCFHCSRRNEDGCSYDVVLRRRGPGRKNKSKGKSSERSESSGAAA